MIEESAIPDEAVHEAVKALIWQATPKTLAECERVARAMLEATAQCPSWSSTRSPATTPRTPTGASHDQ